MSPSCGGRKSGRVHSFRNTSSLTLLALLAASPSTAEPAQPNEGTQLPRVVVTSPPPSGRSKAGRPKQAVRPPAAPATPVTTTEPTAPLTTPLNTGAVPGSATRLGLPVLQTPASVEVVGQQTMKEQGYRTTTETAQGAVGVLSGDAAGAPAGFQMRGFSFGQVNVLYNGISTGPQSITSRWMDTAALQQVEFLKGPSALMSGLNAIGGSVNYVSLQPTPGPIRNELDLSLDTLGGFRSHFGSTGTMAKNLDYRFDAIGTKLNGFIDDVNRNLTALSTQFNYRVNNDFKTFVAVEYKKDTGHAYWGTPLIPTSFAGSFAKSGVVSGTTVARSISPARNSAVAGKVSAAASASWASRLLSACRIFIGGSCVRGTLIMFFTFIRARHAGGITRSVFRKGERLGILNRRQSNPDGPIISVRATFLREGDRRAAAIVCYAGSS